MQIFFGAREGVFLVEGWCLRRQSVREERFLYRMKETSKLCPEAFQEPRFAFLPCMKSLYPVSVEESVAIVWSLSVAKWDCPENVCDTFQDRPNDRRRYDPWPPVKPVGGNFDEDAELVVTTVIEIQSSRIGK